MLRGLLIRQVFFAVDLLLMCVIGGAAIFTILRLLDTSAVDIGAATAGPSAESDVNLPDLGDKADYAGIVTTQLFGPAGQTRKPDAPVEPEGPTIDVDVSNLPLRLLGSSFTTPTDPRSSATIENARSSDPRQKVRTYFVSQEIMPQVVLHEVHKGYVVLKSGPKLERLELRKREGAPVRQAVAARTQPAAALPDAPGVKTLDREDIVNKLVEASAQLAGMNPRLAVDEAGNTLGVTADGLNDLPLAQELGFQDGDIVQNINGQSIDSLEKVTEILQQFSDVDTMRINVKRGDRTQMMNFRLQ